MAPERHLVIQVRLASAQGPTSAWLGHQSIFGLLSLSIGYEV